MINIESLDVELFFFSRSVKLKQQMNPKKIRRFSICAGVSYDGLITCL